MGALALGTPLARVGGIGLRFLKYLERLGLRTVRDLLWHFPTRYEDFSEIKRIADLEPGERVTVQGIIRRVNLRRTWQRRMMIVEAVIEDASGSVRAVWFNQPFLKQTFRPGRFVSVAGKVAESERDLYLSHPTYEFVSDRGLTRINTRINADNPRESALSSASISGPVHTGRLVPVYPETHGLTSKGIRFLVQPLLAAVGRLPEWLPEEVRRTADLPELNEALSAVHFPEKVEDALAAKRRFAFEDLFLLQLLNAEEKLKLARETAPPIRTTVEHIKEILAELPFVLTVSQKKSLWEIVQDLARAMPMNRLLQGDVGSGKTVVAATAALIASENGYQTAIMAPTEVLARQHFATFERLLGRMRGPHHPTIGLLTASESKIVYERDLEVAVTKREFRKRAAAGDVQIVIGTHALIQKGVDFNNLALVIIDEQHRFGVRQRAELKKPEGSEPIPHLLSMSATPIPRTLTLTIFGDLDLSLISELPSGRKKIITKIVDPANRPKAYAFIREQIKKGRQAFVICPRIEPQMDADNKQIDADTISAHPRFDRRASAFDEVKTVKEEYEKLSKQVFPDLRVAMLHGQLKAKEKEKIMREFKEGRTDILVSTSVVEVGVDIPNATIMMIEGSDRFGLAQLYQFRGRVGRGEHQSFCLLFTDSDSRTARERLTAIVEAKNGFELAERDLKLRGPGQFFGEEQSGLPDVAMAGLQDPELVRESRAAALRIAEADPSFAAHPTLKARLAEFRARIHLE